MVDPEPDEDLGEVVERIVAALPHLPRARVEGAVRAVAAQYAGARVRAFLPILIERGARARLTR